MYEITYEENTCLNQNPESVGSHYDFTFEYRYDISHRPRKNRIEYTVYDRTTGLIHAVMEVNAPINASEYRSRVLKALRKYPLVSSVQDVASFIDSVKDESYKKEVLRE